MEGTGIAQANRFCKAIPSALLKTGFRFAESEAKARSVSSRRPEDLSSLELRLPDLRRGEAVHDCGCLEAVWRAELAQDMRDVDAGRLDADNEGRGDLAVRAAASDEAQDLRL